MRKSTKHKIWCFRRIRYQFEVLVWIFEVLIECLILCVFAAMEELLAELRVFLELLDREYLTAGVREKKQQILNILHRVLATRGKRKKKPFNCSFDLWPQMNSSHCTTSHHHNSRVPKISQSFKFFSILNVFFVCALFSQSPHVRQRYTHLSRPLLRCPYQRFLTPGW